MAVPVSYTDLTFKQYLRDEVLKTIFIELGWFDIVLPPSIGHVYTIQGSGAVGSWNAGYVDTLPLAVTIPQGASVTLNGVTTTTKVIAKKGETRILINASIPTFGTGYTGTHTTTVAEEYNAMSVAAYDGMLNETLFRLGIDTLTGYTDIKRLRMYGRREAWRHAMWATAGDYDTASENQTLNRELVYAQAKELFFIELYRIEKLEAGVAGDSESDYFTESGQINPVWS